MKKITPKVAAAGILLFSSDSPRRFLLMRHPDRWDLPKGHAEPDETLRQTALRETEEETGIEKSQIVLDRDFSFSQTYPVTYRDHGNQIFEKTVTYFLGFVDRQWPISCSEHAGYQWFDWSPPHAIQTQTIDPLLAAVAEHLSRFEQGQTDR
ncbi:MAG TPA: DNA mismatch repair protein MutT [Planctomycetaceae bacterium]|nr:DNA mismatch repair protein MutT [Planctomycetaceae bacterium]